MVVWMIELISLAASNSLAVFCFCNVIIAILVVGGSKTSSDSDEIARPSPTIACLNQSSGEKESSTNHALLCNKGQDRSDFIKFILGSFDPLPCATLCLMVGNSGASNLYGHDHKDGVMFRRLEQHLDRHFDSIQTQIAGITQRMEILEMDVGSDTLKSKRLQHSTSDSSDNPEESIDEFASRRRNIRMQAHRHPRGDIKHNHEMGTGRKGASEFRLKIDIPSFDGTLNIEDFLDWVTDVDRFFEHVEVLNEKRAAMVACRLKSVAAAWWDMQLRDRELQGKARVFTWRKMRGMIVDEYLPADYDQTTRTKLSESTSQQVARCMEELKPQIRNRIGIQHIKTLRNAKSFALKAEQMIMIQQNPFRNQQNSDRTRPTGQTAGDTPAQQNNKKKGATEGFKNTPAQQQQGGRKPQSKPLFSTIHGEPEFCDPDGDGDMNDVDPDNDLLAGVCRRVLTAPKVEDSQTQRHQLFCTRCTIKGKIFTILIDGGSMDNIIGGKVARTLELQMEPHPNPYNLGWIATTSGGIHVAQRCKFDVGSCHDGRTNTYSFEKGVRDLYYYPYIVGNGSPLWNWSRCAPRGLISNKNFGGQTQHLH
ncbi:hypothetical protein SASPL_123049 [Salvia splendens]|uniref:Retrotransposon gag domain-containing protein n=1 Tax=Salvia splendens TaxID=180675 RepID=A0A8X8XQG3_SALSN|nr:hypothetical protein SASPL_123049 [Salvia splendens]